MNVRVEEPGKDNVHNNAFYAEETVLRSELEAMRDCDPLSARHWIVSFLTHLICLTCETPLPYPVKAINLCLNLFTRGNYFLLILVIS